MQFVICRLTQPDSFYSFRSLCLCTFSFRFFCLFFLCVFLRVLCVKMYCYWMLDFIVFHTIGCLTLSLPHSPMMSMVMRCSNMYFHLLPVQLTLAIRDDNTESVSANFSRYFSCLNTTIFSFTLPFSFFPFIWIFHLC